MWALRRSSFEENLEMKKGFQQRMETIFDEEELNQKVSERNSLSIITPRIMTWFVTV